MFRRGFPTLGNGFLILGNGFPMSGNDFLIYRNDFLISGNSFLTYRNSFLTYRKGFVMSAKAFLMSRKSRIMPLRSSHPLATKLKWHNAEACQFTVQLDFGLKGWRTGSIVWSCSLRRPKSNSLGKVLMEIISPAVRRTHETIRASSAF